MQWLKKLLAPRFSPQGAADAVVAQAKQALGADLLSVVAYGSWAVGEYMEGHSDLNLLLVARRLDADALKRLSPLSRSWGAQERLKVQFFSPPELRRLAEAFPLEFADMAETRKVLHGEDPFGRMEASASRLAYELEVEARSTLARFRHRWLLGPGGDAEARALASATVGWLFPILRGLLRLRKRRPPRQRVRLIEEVCRQSRLSRRTLLQAHDLRYGRKNAERIDLPGLMERLLSELERVVELTGKAGQEGGAEGAPERERAERPERGERAERPERERGERGERGDRRSRFGGLRPGFDRNKALAEVRQLIGEASQKKRWEPKEPERFVSDELSRDASLSASARFGWDRAWQPERRARGWAPPAAPAPEPAKDDDDELFDQGSTEGAPEAGEGGEAAPEAVGQPAGDAAAAPLGAEAGGPGEEGSGSSQGAA